MASGICFTVAELKTRLGLTGTTYDSVLSSILDGVDAAIQAYLGFDPGEVDIVEYLSTRGEIDTPLRRHPVSSVTTVHEDRTGRFGQNPDGAFATATLLVEGTDYTWTANGLLSRVNARWPLDWERGVNRLADTQAFARGCVKVVYVVDNSKVMAAAKQAGLLEGAAHWFSLKGTGQILTDGMDGASVSVSVPPHLTAGRDGLPKFLSPMTELILQPFRRARLV